MTSQVSFSLRTGTSGGLWLGAVISIALVVIFGGWASYTTISGAVIASGAVVVEGAPRKIQHPDGGVVAEIAVQDGDLVKAGDALVSLDPTVLQTTHDVSLRRIADSLARTFRLEAEIAGAAQIKVDQNDLPFDLTMTTEMAMQREIFTTRAALQKGLDDTLQETLQRTDNQIAGAKSEQVVLFRRIALIDEELGRVRSLVDRNLALVSQLNDQMQQRAQLTGEAARAAARIVELEDFRRAAVINAAQEKRSFRNTAVLELAAARKETEELNLEIITRVAQLDRVVLRAPVTGVVHELQVHSPGGVIAPGTIVMQIIPKSDLPLIEINVDPRGVDQVNVGQEAEVILSSFDPRDTPKLNGIVTRISADAVQDPRTGHRFYRVAVALSATEVARMGNMAILPGMPVEAFLKTQSRTVLTYLVQPFTNQIRRAFREG